MNLNALDARDIRQGMKRGIGFEECLLKYGCTDSDLVYHIRRLFVTDGDDIIRQMRKISDKNQAESLRRGKRLQKQSRKLAERAAENAQVATEGVENTSNPPPMEISTSPSDPLAELHAQEQSLSNTVIKLESEHKRLNGLHYECLDQMRGIQSEIEAIREALKEKGTAYEQIVQRNNKLVQDMNDISRRRSEQIIELRDIQQQIEALTVIEVFVYTNGNIETVDNQIKIVMDDTGNDELYAELIQRSDFQDLRMRDIRTLARITQIVHNSKVQIQPVFEDECLEPFFQSLTA